MKKQLRKNWQLGFLGFFSLFAFPGIIKGNWIQAIWLVWFVWFIYLIPIKKR